MKKRKIKGNLKFCSANCKYSFLGSFVKLSIMKKTTVVLVQLGSPKSPSKRDVKVFLKEFLGDPRVVDMNPLAWKVILNLFVLPFRPKSSAQKYERIWNGHTFPLIENTQNLAKKLEQKVDSNISVREAYILSSPRIEEVLSECEGEVLILPQFPQYSESTTASVIDVVSHSLKKLVNI